MRILILDGETKDKLQNLVAYAENNPLTMDDLLDTYNKQLAPVGDMSGHVVNLPFGFRVVYSIEQQVKGDVRHLSISVDDEGKLPNDVAVREVMKLIGFKNELEKCIIKLEEIGPNRQAINVWEIV